MSTCFDDHMLLYSHALMFIWFYVHRFQCLYAPMSTYFYVQMLFDYVLTCIDITCLISTHMCTHLGDEMSIGLKAKVIVYLHFRELNCFDDCA